MAICSQDKQHSLSLGCQQQSQISNAGYNLLQGRTFFSKDKAIKVGQEHTNQAPRQRHHSDKITFSWNLLTREREHVLEPRYTALLAWILGIASKIRKEYKFQI